jgi:ABC-2 type transport system permease protein
MQAGFRYLRLLGALARYGLARELAFRGNFLAKLAVEVIWLGILIIFYRTIFAKTNAVAGWDEAQYLFFIGVYFAVESVIETLFLENCVEFPELVRTGDLDFFLLRPIDEQFLVTCRTIEWSTAPNLVMGALVMLVALDMRGWAVGPVEVIVFFVLFVCAVLLAYSFLVILTSTAIWLIRNQSLMEMWWLFTSLMRYPREIFRGKWASPVGWFFTFIVPVMLVTNVPAQTMVKAFDWKFAALMLLATLAMLWVSRRFFRYALQCYRSASS